MKKLTFVSLFLILALLLAACGATEEAAPVEETEAETPAEAPAEEEEMAEEEEAAGGGIVAEEATAEPVVVEEGGAFNEAPMLAEMVAAGDLPPVDERLPMEGDIMVVAPVDGVGEYGGTWHNASWWQGMGNIAMIVYDPPVRWNADYTGYEPGLVKEWEISEDGKTLTWHFREGVKWSDGEPFVPAVDMAYWWELATNEDFGALNPPFWGRDSDGSLMEVSFPDDYTMVFEWGEPHYVANFVVAQGFWEHMPMYTAKHYLTEFDPNYTEGMTYDDLNTAHGVGAEWLLNVEGRPCLMAWCPTSVESGERSILTRNPYYWKVDTEGNQLPYIDTIDVALVEDAEVRLLEVAQGKYEASFRGNR